VKSQLHLIGRFERTVARALADAGVSTGDRILIAVSGGADSVALTHALHRLCPIRENSGYDLVAAHLNHRLRGDESDRDERFVRDLCARLQVNLFVEVADGLAGMSNLEERARTLRYEFLNRVAAKIDARYIALAHHAGDQAETVIMRLMRGSGAAGLAAMAPAGPGRIVRPMLTLHREEILAYLKSIGEAYVTDTTNQSPAILRNRVRHDLLPMLERDYAPRLRRRLTELATELRALDGYIAHEARRQLEDRAQSPSRLDLTGFAELHPALANATLREFLRTWIGDLRSVYRADIERMRELCLAAAPGSIAQLSRGWRMRCEYGIAVLEQVSDAASARSRIAPAARFEVELSRVGVTQVPESGFTFVARMLRFGDADFPAEPSMPRARRAQSMFDADRIDGRLFVRGMESGDRVRPLGITGSRKVHDVFVDHKLARVRRSTWPIVAANREILWIPGMVRSRSALVTPATKTVLHLTATRDATVQNTSLLRI
jgi:tRNA(Ile)-lysidine synthase